METIVKVWVVRHVDTQHGESEYDDAGGYHRNGSPAYNLPGIYPTKEAAQSVAQAMNRSREAWCDDEDEDADPDTDAAQCGGPFWDPWDGEVEETYAPEGLPGRRPVYADRVDLPWLVFRDYLRERGIPLPRDMTDPEVEEGEEPEVPAVPADRDPSLYELRAWYTDVLTNEEYEGWSEDWLGAVAEVCHGPRLFVADDSRIPAARLEAMRTAWALTGQDRFVRDVKEVAAAALNGGGRWPKATKAAAQRVLDRLTSLLPAEAANGPT